MQQRKKIARIVPKMTSHVSHVIFTILAHNKLKYGVVMNLGVVLSANKVLPVKFYWNITTDVAFKVHKCLLLIFLRLKF